jgi:large subunit ribosomal protein L33
MAKKTHVKVRLVPEAKPDSPFFYYVKKPAGGERLKLNFLQKNTIPQLKNMKCLWKKNCLHTVNNIIFS